MELRLGSVGRQVQRKRARVAVWHSAHIRSRSTDLDLQSRCCQQQCRAAAPLPLAPSLAPSLSLNCPDPPRTLRLKARSPPEGSRTLAVTNFRKSLRADGPMLTSSSSSHWYGASVLVYPSPGICGQNAQRLRAVLRLITHSCGCGEHAARQNRLQCSRALSLHPNGQPHRIPTQAALM